MDIIPIVSLDKIYINTNEEDIYFLDCTRINGSNTVVTRQGKNIEDEINRIANSIKTNKVILADDVVFSGSVLREIINKLALLGIEVVQVICSITTREGYEYFNSNLRYGMKTNFIMENEVIDQICERDFYFGIAGSGIFINTPFGLCKAPYFLPYGNPNERASIPTKEELEFSKSCLLRSISLWKELDRLNKKNTLIKELPERIVNTEGNDEVVKTLKKELERL